MTNILVEGCPEVVKNKESCAVLAVDYSAYQAHMNKRQLAIDTQVRLGTLEDKMTSIESLLLQILNRV